MNESIEIENLAYYEESWDEKCKYNVYVILPPQIKGDEEKDQVQKAFF